MELYRDRPSGTVARARELRRSASGPERRLLRALREAFPTLKWRHQVPFGAFYADILCFSERLVIEVDGDTHDSSEAADEARSRFMAREGFRTLRFGNQDVMTSIDGVLIAVGGALGQAQEGGRA